MSSDTKPTWTSPQSIRSSKLMIAVFAVCIVGLGGALAAVATGYWFPNQATIPGQYSLEITLDTVITANGTLIDWGPLTEATSKTLAVTNTGNAPVTVLLATVNLPDGWTETWERDGETIPIDGTVTGLLTVDPHDGLAGPYSWDWGITVTP